MSATMYLTRATLRREVSSATLRALLFPADHAARMGAGHKLVWSLFADKPDRARDFLWRETDGVYHLLSRRLPDDQHRLFDLDESRPFTPELSPGDLLHFSLRANATISKKMGSEGGRGKLCDVVMDALYRIPTGERAEARRSAVTRAGLKWLGTQAERNGFSICADDASEHASTRVTSYRTVRVEHAGPAARIGVLDFEGELRVESPRDFVESLGKGFGRAKAFGCGLMLVRRVGRVR